MLPECSASQIYGDRVMLIMLIRYEQFKSQSQKLWAYVGLEEFHVALEIMSWLRKSIVLE